jgi:hypothetical protein
LSKIRVFISLTKYTSLIAAYKNIIKIQRIRIRDILIKNIKTTENTTKRDDSNFECCPVPVFCPVSVSSRGSGPLISQTALEKWPTTRVCGSGVEEDERLVKMVAKVELSNP